MSTEVAALRSRQARQRRWGVGLNLVQLGWLAWPIVEVVTGDEPTWVTALAIALTAAFIAAYWVGMASAFGWRRRWLPRAMTVVLVAIPAGLAPLIGVDSAPYLIFTGILTVFTWPVRVSVPAIAAFTAWAAILPSFAADAGTPRVLFPILIAALSLVMFAVRRMRSMGREIERAHEQLAELAVADERSRFARELHDILGHSLTSITVKAQLAGKLVDRDTDRLRAEIADIERLAREGLEDVRRTVAGYRKVTLAAELVSARSALESAGIRAELPQAVDAVPGRHRELFGWVLREGVTNVVRHSGADRCQVRLSPASIEVLDDGRGANGNGSAGHGLSGLRERVTAAGGDLRAGSTPAGGYSLSVQVGS